VHPTRPQQCHVFTTSQRVPLRLLHLHIDRGLRDMGTHGSPPIRVPKVPAKWTRPAKSPTDLQVGPITLSTDPTTLEDSEQPYPDSHAWSARHATRLRPGATCRSVDHGILLVIRADSLPFCNRPRHGSTNLEWKP
jgi:hypothetical protein